jgi:hypothetical protein
MPTVGKSKNMKPAKNGQKATETGEHITFVDESPETIQLIERALYSPTVHRTRSRATDREND